MRIWNVPADRLEEIVSEVSRNKYGGNITFKEMPASVNNRCLRFTLTVVDSNGDGARISPSGRRVAAACWHAHRDVFRAIFKEYPDARIKTSHADYRGEAHFDATFDATGNTPVQAAGGHRATFRYACDCES